MLNKSKKITMICGIMVGILFILAVMAILLISLAWGCLGLPGITYAGESNDIRIEVTYQTIHTIDSTVTNQNDLWFMSSSFYDTTPKPNAEFTNAARSQSTKCIYIGSDANKDSITQIGLSIAPVYEGDKRPTNLRDPSQELSKPIGDMMVGGSNTGEQWASKKLNPGWNSTITMDGGGGSTDPTKDIEHPEYFVADLYLNNEKVANIDLTLQKGEAE